MTKRDMTNTIPLEQLYCIFRDLELTNKRPSDFPIVLSREGQEVEVSLDMFYAVLQKEIHAHRSWCGATLN